MTEEKKFDIRKFLKEKGYSTISADWDAYISNWGAWYKGLVPAFHKYFQYNGQTNIHRERSTLEMAKKLCEDKADLLLNEKVTIKLATNDTQKLIDKILKDNSFWICGNQLIELTGAKGTGAFVEYDEAGSVRIDYIQADCIYPLKWRKRGVIDCAFASTFTENGVKKYYVNIHVLENDEYVIYNYYLDENGKELVLPDNMEAEIHTGQNIPRFQIYKLNICNNVDTTSPMGISIFANSINVLKGLDLVYDSYNNEFKLGKKRLFIKGDVLKPVPVIKADGTTVEMVPIFDPNDTEFYSFEFGDDEDSIKEINMELRSEEHTMAIQLQLDLLSEKCGFGKGYYKFEASSVKTATEVISQDSQLYRKIKKDEIILEEVLINMIKSILSMSGKDIETEISISFDDSIFEDTDAKAKRALLEFQNNLIDEVEYFKRVYDMEQKAAEKHVSDIKGRMPTEPQKVDFMVGGDA